VKIDLHHQLLTWRGEIARRGLLPWSRRLPMTALAFVLRRPRLYALAGRMGRWMMSLAPRWLLYHRLNTWGRQRDLPPVPAKSFRELYARRNGQPH
jgi:L-lactate dehydrogenase complex protein LldF